MSSSTLTMCLDDELKNRLERLADTKSFLAIEAIGEYVKRQKWQIQEIQNGIAEANAGQLIEHEHIVKRWKKKHTNSVNKKR